MENISDKQQIIFEEGILAFEEYKNYILLEDEDSPFYWLQSVDNTELAFALIDPLEIHKTYSPKINKQYLEKIGQGNDEDYAIYVIANIPEEVNKMTVNLRAPIVINVNLRKGIQVIVENEEYKTKHKVFQQDKKGD